MENKVKNTDRMKYAKTYKIKSPETFQMDRIGRFGQKHRWAFVWRKRKVVTRDKSSESNKQSAGETKFTRGIKRDRNDRDKIWDTLTS